MKKVIFLLILSVGVSTMSCRKTEGCTDKNASNYNPDADKENNSCVYKGQLVIWWNETFRNDASTLGVTSINVYVDNSFIGAIAVSTQYFAGAPECNASGTVTANIDLGTSKTKNVAVKYDLYQGTTLIGNVSENLSVSNGCNSWQLQ
jgi:hypothetical protein